MLTRIRRRAPVVAPALLLALTLLAPATAYAQQQPVLSVPIVGALPGIVGGTINGVFNITSFAVQNGQLVALGTLSAVLNSAAGPIGSIVTQLAIPVSALQNSTCDILHLVLGPLDLTLLGLNVHLNQVVLDITATQGPGNLLGNLLCAVAGLLDNQTGLAGLLNKILGALQL